MDKTKTIAIAVVAIVVIAAVAIVLTRGGGEEKRPEIDSQLRVFGNADGNYTIDSADLDLIDRMIAGEGSLEEHPLADANHDGKVDEADRDLVRKIVNDEPCTVYHYNTCSTGDYVVDTAWPIKSALATGASNMLWLLTMAGADDMVHGITYSKSSPPDPALFPAFSKMESIGGSSTKLPVEAASNYISQYGCTAVISDKTASTVDKNSVEVQYEEMGVDVIRVGPALVDVDEFCSEMFLIGFLFQTEEQCKDIAEWWTSLQDEIDSRLEGVPKVSAITCNGKELEGGRIWVSAGTSDYVDVIVAAGGEYALDDKVLTDYSSGAYFNRNDTWLYDYDFDYIVSIRTNDWYSGTVDDAAKYSESLDIFEHTQAYEKGNAFVITGDAPIPVRIAYAAAVMYPDVFGTEWADGVNQDFFEKFTDLDIDFDSLHFVITQEMAKGTS